MLPFGALAKRAFDRYYKNRDPEVRLAGLEDALSTVIRRSGADSGPAARGRVAVADQLEGMGRYTEARLLREAAFTAHRRNLGDDDEQTVIAEASLALNLAESDLPEEAKAHFMHVHEVRLRTLGPQNDRTKWCERWIAYLDREAD
jgi:hypothetical protein